MALTNAEIGLISQGIQLAVDAVLAAFNSWQNSGSNTPIDWSTVRIVTTPEQALDDAKAKK